MDNVVFGAGLAALAQVTITFLILIKTILSAPGRNDAMISRPIAVLLGVLIGAVVIPHFLPPGATTDALYARLVNARESIFRLGGNFMGLTIVGYVSTYGLHLLGLAHESERLRDYLLLVVCLVVVFLLRIFVETMFRFAPGDPGFLFLQILPAVACSVGSLLALMHIHSSRRWREQARQEEPFEP
jgi:Na+/phosphate symporter